jgi:hypothetical protein
MKRWRGSLATAVVIAAGLMAAPAVEAAPPPSHTFSGTCSVEGPVDFSPPATTTQQLLWVDYQAKGTCSGTYDGQSVSNVPVTMHNQVQSNGSCLYAKTIAPGDGVLAFSDAAFRYTLEFTYVGTDGEQSFTGRRGGSAIGRGSFLTPNSSPDGASGCSNGKGVAQIPMDLTIVTESPLLSSRDHSARNSSDARR